ncbi:DUF4226 domain-containing protein [Mycolicibacterium mageritense]|uniref:DUF4226 domain-containing protein n=1 Tax=Mycolicibacterium mageritense TaxID=53462 RepID=UPI001E3D9BC4|nr:DUF4226 domain-containing protein [Mycolicibacterium mageritense]GJJ23757.1 hypothetical protein MTY414_74310 [Mycolicibacterium mageritense]
MGELDRMAEDLMAVLTTLTAPAGVDDRSIGPMIAASASGGTTAPASEAAGVGAGGAQSQPWNEHLEGWSGAGADELRSADQALAQARRDREDIDQQFTRGIEEARGAARASQERLRAVLAEVEAAQLQLRPSLDTQAGRQQYAELLESKLAEVQTILADAQESHGRGVTALMSAAARYGTTPL